MDKTEALIQIVKLLLILPKTTQVWMDEYNKWTSGIFFSSANAIDTSAWHMINSTAPAPESYKWQCVETHNTQIWKKKTKLGWHACILTEV